MAIEDSWHLKDGTPSAHFGQGRRWRLRWHGQSKSMADVTRKSPGPRDRPPKNVELAWAKMITAEPRRKVSEVKVSELIDRWLATKKGLSPRGYRACLDASAHVRREWGGRLASTIVTEEVQVWIASLTWSPSMKHKLLQALSGSLDLTGAVNPCKGVKVPKEVRRDPVFLEPEELGKLAAETGQYETFVLFLGTVGARIGEVCSLNIGDVDRRRKRIWIPAPNTKTRKGRDLPVPVFVWDRMSFSRPTGETGIAGLPILAPGARSDPLFVNSRGHRVNKDNFRARHFEPAVQRAGLDGLHIHDLRHTAASLAIRAGADVKAVQKMMGHSSAQMTLDLYGHLWDQGLDDVAARVGRLFGGNE